VRLSVVHPGGIATNIARNARTGVNLRGAVNVAELGDRFAKLARTSPEAAARRIIRGIEGNEPRILIGPDARMLDVVQRLMPARYWTALARIFKGMSDDLV